MAIKYNEAAGVITLTTEHSSYQMKIDEKGVLLHTYYGRQIEGNEDLSYRILPIGRGFSGNFSDRGMEREGWSPDGLPQEYSCFGTGDYRITALCAEHENGGLACELRVADVRVEQGKYSIPGLPAVYADQEEAETLVVTMKDPYAGFDVELYYGLLPGEDVITRCAVITNTGDTRIRLKKAASMNLDFINGSYDLMTFYGGHTTERQIERARLHHGVQSVGSVRGTSSHHYNPFAVLCGEHTTETAGECFGISFLYSGEFLLEAEKDFTNQTRLILGIHPANFEWTLAPGESFHTPEVLLTWSGEGFGEMSRHLHHTIRQHICRGIWRDRVRPVLINNWEATYFNFTGEKLCEIASTAESLGMDLFVMDDGWFGDRDDDFGGLGDWTPNEKKLGCTLGELGDRITARGMKFGIWFEPEAISERSDLYRAHPEWAVKIPGRTPGLSRHQMVLDFSREDVQDYIIESISSVLKQAPIGYVKWDMNRSICDKWSGLLPADRQGEFAHRYVLGLYRVLETLTTTFPEVLFEGCSGGGGRFDAGMMYYTPQIWCSDNTDAIDRLFIQYGTSFGYPVSTMGSHVSAVPNHQTGRVTPLATRGAVAMAGTFGYELDVTKLSESEKEEIKRQITFFRSAAELIQQGDYYRLSTEKDPCVIWEHVDPAGEKALVFAVQSRSMSNAPLSYCRLRGLSADRQYAVRMTIFERDGSERVLENTLSGAALMEAGLVIPPARFEYQARRIELQAL